MLIKNATLVTWDSLNQILENQALFIENDKISEAGPTSELEARHLDAETLDARGQLVMPGNICAHTHFYGAFARGMGIPGEAPRDCPEILEKTVVAARQVPARGRCALLGAALPRRRNQARHHHHRSWQSVDERP